MGINTAAPPLHRAAITDGLREHMGMMRAWSSHWLVHVFRACAGSCGNGLRSWECHLYSCYVFTEYVETKRWNDVSSTATSEGFLSKPRTIGGGSSFRFPSQSRESPSNFELASLSCHSPAVHTRRLLIRRQSTGQHKGHHSH